MDKLVAFSEGGYDEVNRLRCTKKLPYSRKEGGNALNLCMTFNNWSNDKRHSCNSPLVRERTFCRSRSAKSGSSWFLNDFDTCGIHRCDDGLTVNHLHHSNILGLDC